jgi:FkbM family methyltransferase
MSFFGRPLQCFHQPSVVSFFREIFIYQHYNPPMALGPAPVIIDAGCNIGLFAIYAAMVLPNARLRVFEADPTTCTALRANIATYVGDRAVVVNVALADGAGTIRIVNDGGNPNRSTNTIMRELLAADAPGVSSAEVPMGDFRNNARICRRLIFSRWTLKVRSSRCLMTLRRPDARAGPCAGYGGGIGVPTSAPPGRKGRSIA